MRTELGDAGLSSVETTLELAMCFHPAVRDAHDELAAAISRLRDLTQNGIYAYYVYIAHFMADHPLDSPHPRSDPHLNVDFSPLRGDGPPAPDGYGRAA